MPCKRGVEGAVRSMSNLIVPISAATTSTVSSAIIKCSRTDTSFALTAEVNPDCADHRENHEADRREAYIIHERGDAVSSCFPTREDREGCIGETDPKESRVACPSRPEEGRRRARRQRRSRYPIYRMRVRKGLSCVATCAAALVTR